ncbi:MAG: hypothetical protein RSA40_02055 [Malacoplasma sp.]
MTKMNMNLIDDENEIEVSENNAKNNELNKDINDKGLPKLKTFYRSSKSAAVGTLVCLCLSLFLIPILIGWIIQLVWCIRCLTLKNEELKQDCLLWGILGLLILPVIPIFIIKTKTLTLIEKYDSNFRW